MNYLDRIRGLREDRDFTQVDVATYLNIAQNTYSQYERGKRAMPIEILIRLCELYTVSADYILCLSEN